MGDHSPMKTDPKYICDAKKITFQLANFTAANCILLPSPQKPETQKINLMHNLLFKVVHKGLRGVREG